MITRVGLAALALLGTTSSAQDEPEDWQLTERDDLTAASVAFDNGISVVVRCQNGGLETYIGGLPPLRRRDDARRTLDYAFGDAVMRPSTWQTNDEGTVLFADLPAPLARRFRTGGDLQIRTEAAEDQPARRYVVSLPASAAAVDHVLVGCGRPTTDPRDALRLDETSEQPTEDDDAALSWRRHPNPRYPDTALRRGLSGMAVISCFAREDGRLEDCRIEVDRPMGAGFGTASLRAATDARVSAITTERVARSGGLVTFTIRFQTP